MMFKSHLRKNSLRTLNPWFITVHHYNQIEGLSKPTWHCQKLIMDQRIPHLT